jgi:glycosyltransferase involved in cell wall biosynthesis
VIPEAYAAGVPVLAVRQGGIPEIADAAHLVESARPEILAAAIRELTATPRALCEMADAGRSAWQRRFTLERYRAEVLDLVEAAVRTVARR